MYIKSLITASLLALSPGYALTLDIHSDTDKRLDFSLDWRDGSPAVTNIVNGIPQFEHIFYNGASNLFIEWFEYPANWFGNGSLPVAGAGIDVDLAPEIGPFGGDIFAGLSFNFVDTPAIGEYLEPTNLVASTSRMDLFKGAKTHPSGYSARFVFDRQKHNVPDAGSTLGLLGFAIAGLGFLKRKLN